VGLILIKQSRIRDSRNTRAQRPLAIRQVRESPDCVENLAGVVLGRLRPCSKHRKRLLFVQTDKRPRKRSKDCNTPPVFRVRG
jgi:hypothetical protein